ncbi:MAG: ribonuclease BN [Omnitrophica WOR_2 bacterium SM23_72]|nr:MAG: ribonuclease BN [Omnitrophica WOR_2 bacterium SM23_72]
MIQDMKRPVFSKVIDFLKTDIWRVRLKSHSRPKSFLLKHLIVFLASLKGFDENKCQLRASALTYYSLLSIVPVIAMAFGVAKGFGFEKLLQKQLLDKFPAQQEIFTQLFSFANTLLENTKGGVVAGIGVALLFWTVIKVLGNIERSFNDIWGIKKQRSLARKFSDYLSIMFICPILVVVSSGFTVFVATQIQFITQKISLLGVLAPLISLIIKILPYGVLWVLFAFIYIFMPNTKVNLKSGIFAGIVAGTIYQLAQWVYIEFQVGVAKYNAIYGSFAALPLFLVWLQLSWLIVLFGAEISFAHQNVDMYEFEPDCLRVSYSFKRLLTLRVVHLLIKNFARGERPLTMSEISHALEIPTRLLRQILYELVESGILSEASTKEYKELGFQPAIDIDLLTIRFVVDALEGRGVDTIPVAQSKELTVLSESLKTFGHTIERSPANKLLKEI